MAKVKPIPDGYHAVQPYLMMEIPARRLSSTKGLWVKQRLCMKEPSGRVAHAEIEIGDSCVMMADENPSIKAYSASIMAVRRLACRFTSKIATRFTAKPSIWARRANANRLTNFMATARRECAIPSAIGGTSAPTSKT